MSENAAVFKADAPSAVENAAQHVPHPEATPAASTAALLRRREILLARADAADAVIAAARKVRKCVDMQAEDYGLWCAAKTATERYMQRELRYLHALVESMPLAHLDSLGGSDFTESL